MDSRRLSGLAMKELVEGDKLKRVDILLTRSQGSLVGWLIRFGTRSYWNHAAMVYVIRDPKEGYSNTFIIESSGGGVDIHNISHYFERPKQHDVGIRRLETEWFQSGKTDFPRKVRGLALQEIDDKYDYRRLVNIGRRILRQMILAFLFPWLRTRPEAKRRARLPRIARIFGVNSYICSGFVQWAYYTTVVRAQEKRNASEQMLRDVIFNPEILEAADEDTLLSTTPADIANCDRLRWKYIIKDGTVWEISNDRDVDDILRPGS
ncbi:MAG: hypothetical protein HY673_18230 [Chloroflexi bacterium]|nr:hypothetical protein [Chloroflexota bacterium]